MLFFQGFGIKTFDITFPQSLLLLTSFEASLFSKKSITVEKIKEKEQTYVKNLNNFFQIIFFQNTFLKKLLESLRPQII